MPPNDECSNGGGGSGGINEDNSIGEDDGDDDDDEDQSQSSLRLPLSRFFKDEDPDGATGKAKHEDGDTAMSEASMIVTNLGLRDFRGRLRMLVMNLEIIRPDFFLT